MTQPTSAAQPVDVGLRLQVEHVAVRRRDAREVAAGAVQDALRLGRRARRVQDVERMLGIERLRRAGGIGGGGDLVVVRRRGRLHLTRRAGAAHDDDRLEAREIAHRLVDGDPWTGAVLPLRAAPSTVISSFASENSMRSRTASAEKPPNTTLCGAPIRAQASIATTTSGIIGR